jgi:hypothetical protein
MSLSLFLLAQAPAVPALIHLLIVVIVLGLIFGIVWWALGYLPLAEPFGSIARFIVILIFALILIYLLLPLI